MSSRAKVAGAVGTVVDGRIRDLNEHRELDYPVRLQCSFLFLAATTS
jgi:regulator of RNase E activity RraA